MKYLRMMIIGLLISLSSSYILVTLSVLSNNAVMSGAELLRRLSLLPFLVLRLDYFPPFLISSQYLLRFSYFYI